MANRICSVDDCERPLKGLGMCDKHYQRARRNGTPDRQAGRPEHPADLGCVRVKCEQTSASLCHFPDCERKIVERALCASHFQQLCEDAPLSSLKTPRVYATCTAPECDRDARYAGYCKSHWDQLKRHGVTSAIRPYKPGGVYAELARNESGEKPCQGGCGRWLPESNFHRSAGARDGLDGSCKDCKARRRRAFICVSHNLAEADYERMSKAQGDRCKICERREPRGWLVIDHDHDCCPGKYSCGQCIRGLLCSRCNAGLGMLGDDEGRVAAALAYLRATAKLDSRG